MPASFKLFLLLIFSILQGCQLLDTSHPSAKEEVTKTDRQDNQVQNLLQQGTQYSKLNKEGRKQACKQLILDYEVQRDWQSAWLMIYLLNDDFNCLSKTKTIELLKTIQSDKNMAVSLKWMNNNQINLLNSLIYFQSTKNKFKKKNNYLESQLEGTRVQLEQAEVQLKDVISKIQALKVIETTINQKTE